ncbi:winged helix-turn-helix domain-containing protein [Phaeobacter gallaeciensis]|nr:winged helix-turn-helix domain-containing protein [Phaeobacter gallaeciensis]
MTPMITAGGISLDPDARAVTSEDDKLVLSRTEYLFLELMTRHVGKIVTRQMLLDRMYAGKSAPKEDIIDTYAHRLRKKLSATFNGTLRLVTVWGQGFVLEINVSEALP